MTSVLNVDTIADKAGTGPVALTKQQAAIALLNYDQSNTTTDSSLNISSVTDETTGITNNALTTNTSSATDRVVLCSSWNTDDDGSSVAAGHQRGLISTCQHHSDNSTSRYDIETCYGSYHGVGAGAYDDTDGVRSAIFGDLA